MLTALRIDRRRQITNNTQRVNNMEFLPYILGAITGFIGGAIWMRYSIIKHLERLSKYMREEEEKNDKVK